MRRTTSRPTGCIIAAPTPCTMRATMNSAKFVLIALTTDATTKIAIAQPNTGCCTEAVGEQPG